MNNIQINFSTGEDPIQVLGVIEISLKDKKRHGRVDADVWCITCISGVVIIVPTSCLHSIVTIPIEDPNSHNVQLIRDRISYLTDNADFLEGEHMMSLHNVTIEEYKNNPIFVTIKSMRDLACTLRKEIESDI